MEMERMAFNVHLTWEKNLNIDYEKIKSEFRDKYNHTSSILNVLSLKYKLYGVGIDLGTMSFSEAAKAFNDSVMSDSKKKDKLVYLEHRRWVTEKVCNGYRRLTDLEYCLTGKTRNDEEKLHICLARSSTKNKLDKWSREQWDTSVDFEGLDELEKMSVQLHQKYMEQVDSVKKLNLISGENTSSIISLIDRDNECYIAFQEWLTCIKDIWNNDIKQVKIYSGLKESFSESVKNSEKLSENVKRHIADSVKWLHENFYPIYASREYRNYKKDDVALVEKIPFILTYSTEFSMVIPYSLGNSHRKFANVAVPTVVNPKWIIYLYYCNNIGQYQELCQSLEYLNSYISRKKLQKNVEFIIGYDGSFIIPNSSFNIEKRFYDVTKGCCKKTSLYVAGNEKEFIEQVRNYLEERKNCFIEQNDTTLSRMIVNTELLKDFPTYSFDSQKMKFTSVSNSEILSYIGTNTFITATDMIALKLSTSKTSNKPEFYQDYKKLWKLYRRNPSVWKSLCCFFKKVSAEADNIAKFYSSTNKNSSPKMYRYIIPFVCEKTVRKILQKLIDTKLIDKDSSINVYTTDCCEVIIYDWYKNQGNFNKLFTNPYYLVDPNLINCYATRHAPPVVVEYNQLHLENADCSELKPEQTELINDLIKMSYLTNVYPISNPKIDPKIRFTYPTARIKDLLTVEGRILEIYTYHKAKEQEFDDIRSSFELEWKDETIKKELDCLLTKGFSTVLVECKAVKSLDSNFYTKLSSLAEEFGVNTKTVIVADLNGSHAEDNARVIQEGNERKVITVSDPQEIDDIGNILYQIINGEYKQE